MAFSGGIDPGLIAALAKKYARSVTCYTCGTDDSFDFAARKELAEKLGDRHIFFNDRHEAEELQVFYHSHRHCHVVSPGNSEAELVYEGIEHHSHDEEKEG